MEKKDACYSTFPNFDCPENCPGLKDKFVADSVGGEGYYVQLCQDPSKAGSSPSGANYCGLGPDVLVFYKSEFPTDDEIRSIAGEIL